MKPPIFVYEPADLSVFESIAKTERYIEPQDVKDAVYFFYDSEGKELEAFVEKDSRGIEYCIIKEPRTAVFSLQKLREMIVEMLVYLGEVHLELDYKGEQLETLDLKELIEESLKFKTE